MNARSAGIHRDLDKLRRAARQLSRPVTFMEVCGTHTMSAFRTGLHSLMPEGVTLLSGPGCPVCVTAQGDIDLMITLASERDVTLCTYGDMLRVPGRQGNLERARGRGADVRVVYSSLQAVRIAASEPRRSVVFAAVGFETTAPATAAAVLEAKGRGLENFTVLASHKRVVPAMTALLESDDFRLAGFLCPGHVSVVIGSEAYRPIVDRFAMPCVIAGFEDAQMASGIARLAEQVRDGRAELVNDYPEVVAPHGNPIALALLSEVFRPTRVRWRGLGEIPGSGLGVRPCFAEFDAARRFELVPAEDREPAGCLCAQVITGRVSPHDCELFGTACTPVTPVGPCMVSSEGTCQAWFRYKRARAAPSRAPASLSEALQSQS